MQGKKEILQDFKTNRLSTNSTASFFDPIKKLNLKTFSNLVATTKVKANGKDVIMKADKELLGRMANISKDRVVDPKEIFSYPLGPIPWSLAGPLGEMRKTNKASLLKEVTKVVIEEDALPRDNFVVVIDAMAVVQKAKPADTFGSLAKQLFDNAMTVSRSALRVDIVFDVYQNISIKNLERNRRSPDNILL